MKQPGKVITPQSIYDLRHGTPGLLRWRARMEYRERIEAKVGILFQIADQYTAGQISFEKAKELIGYEMVNIRPAQFEALKTKLGERLKAADRTESEKLFELFKNYLSPPYNKLQNGHPLKNYYEENSIARSCLLRMDEMEGEEAVFDDWRELYELLSRFCVHIKRQEKNLYPLLSPIGMRLQAEQAKELGNAINHEIEKNRERLEDGSIVDFLYHQRGLIQSFMRYLDLEERVLYPKALIRFTDRDFADLRSLDDQDGYAYMEQPEDFIPSEVGIKRANAGPDPGLILSALLEAKELGLEYYTLTGELVSVMGSEIAEPSRVMESIVRDRFGTAHGTLKIIEKISGKEETDGAHKRDAEPKEIDSRQSIEELFRMYPKFREDFFHLDEELEGLKGTFGRDLLKDSTVEMVAKSLRIDTGSLTDRINELLKSYSCAE